MKCFKCGVDLTHWDPVDEDPLIEIQCEDCYEGIIEEYINDYGEPMSEFEKEFGFDINDEAGYRD